MIKSLDGLNSLVLFLGLTWFSIWGVSYLHIDSLPIPDYWRAIVYHFTCGVLWYLSIRLFVPRVRGRFIWRMSSKTLLVGLFVIAFFDSPNFQDAPWSNYSIQTIASALFFALGIGFNEDLFSRGLIFGLFEKYGYGVAALISSIHFGMLHLTNYFWGGQSFSYTAGQMVNAGAFGFLCAGLMIFSGSIWLPVLLHGLSDFPLQLQPLHEFTAQVKGGSDWPAILIQAAFYIAAGAILLYWRNEKARGRFLSIASHFGLIESTA